MNETPNTVPPQATPDTQAEPLARAGGTYAKNDFSRSAQRSKLAQAPSNPERSRAAEDAEAADQSGKAGVPVSRPYKDTGSI